MELTESANVKDPLDILILGQVCEDSDVEREVEVDVDPWAQCIAAWVCRKSEEEGRRYVDNIASHFALPP